jgi:hypothetical protein
VVILPALGAVQVSKARPVKTFADAGWGGPATWAGVAEDDFAVALDVDVVFEEPPAEALALAPGLAVPDADALAEGLAVPVGSTVPDADAEGDAPPRAASAASAVRDWADPLPLPDPPPDTALAANAAPPPITTTAAAIPA